VAGGWCTVSGEELYRLLLKGIEHPVEWTDTDRRQLGRLWSLLGHELADAKVECVREAMSP
jgi:hypothetical protein